MKLYVVRNKEGKFFKNIGYGGSGGNWQDTLEKAKFYAKIGQAKSRVTFFFKNYPNFGCPDILEFNLDIEKANVLNMQTETYNKIEKSRTKELENQKRYKQQQINDLEREKQKIDSRLKGILGTLD